MIRRSAATQATRAPGGASALRADGIVLREIRIPLIRPFEIASGATAERRVLLLELAHPDGAVAWSECVAGEFPDYSPETADTAWLALSEWLIPRALARDFPGPVAVGPHLGRGLRGHLMARAALEMGFWGLAAALEGRPLAALLGGEAERVPSGITLGLVEAVADIPERVAALRARGYRKVKLKIAPGRDAERLAAAREAAGPDAALAADANGSYDPSDPSALIALDRFGLAVLEQPFEPGDLRRHAALQRRLRTPLGLDESLDAPERVEDMAALGSGRVVNLKPGRVGGLGASLAIHDLCRREGLGLFCGGMLETGLGRAYNVALASLPGFGLPGDVYPPGEYLARDVVRPAWRLEADGTVRVPRPAAGGIGVEVDRDAVEALTVRRLRFGAARRGPVARRPAPGRLRRGRTAGWTGRTDRRGG